MLSCSLKDQSGEGTLIFHSGFEADSFYLAMIPVGGKKQVVSDLTKITHNTEDLHPDGVGDFNPIKLCTSKELIDFMKSREKPYRFSGMTIHSGKTGDLTDI